MRLKRILTTLATFAILSGCSEETTGPHVEPPRQTALSPATAIVDADAVVAYDAATGEAEITGAAAAGDIIAVGIGDVTPDGLLRRVVAIREDGTRRILETVPASLAEAIVSGLTAGAVDLAAAAIDSVSVAEGVELMSGDDAETAFSLSLRRTLDAGVVLDASLAVDATFEFALGLDASVPDRILFALDQVRTTSFAAVAAGPTESFAGSEDIAEIRFARTEARMGSLPVVLQPVLHVRLEYEGNGTSGFDVGCTGTEVARSGAEYAEGTWSAIDDATFTPGALAHELQGPVTHRTTLATEFRILVYGRPGALLSLAAHASAAGIENTSAVPTTLDGSLVYALSAGSIFDPDPFSDHVPADDSEWTAFQGTLWSNGWNAGDPPLPPSAPYPADGAIDVPATTNLVWTSADPDGDPLTYDLYFGTGPTPPLLAEDLSINEFTPDPLELGRSYSWRVVARSGGDESVGGLWTFTVEVDPSTVPEPRFDVVAVTPESFPLGQSFELRISLSNQGAGSEEAGIAVSFPDLDAVDDDLLVLNYGSSRSDAPGLGLFPRGSTVQDATCLPATAGHLLLEYADSNWYAGEQNTLRVLVTPSAIGTFRYRIRAAMRGPGEDCPGITVLPPGGAEAVDQQGRPCREFAVQVREPEPAPVFLDVVRTADTVTLGESFDLHVAVANLGDATDRAGIAVVFPSLDAADHATSVTDFGSSNGDAPGLRVLPHGATLTDRDCLPMAADHLVAEYTDTFWTAGERNDLRLRITPQAIGTFSYRVRSVMDRPLADCDAVVATPDGIVDTVDQQGWPCRDYTVQVLPPEPRPNFESVTRSADTITLGESFDLLLAVANDGDTTDEAGITVSFPALTEPTDDALVINHGSSTGETPGLVLRPAGHTLLGADCRPLAASHLVAEFEDTFWTAGEHNMLGLRITPREPGTFTYYVRSAMRRPLEECSYVISTPDGIVDVVDQQGWNCRAYSVTVLPESAAPH